MEPKQRFCQRSLISLLQLIFVLCFHETLLATPPGSPQSAQDPSIDRSWEGLVSDFLAAEFSPAEIAVASQAAAASDPMLATKFRTRRRCNDYLRLRSPFFGDLHVHTSYSMDSIFAGANPDNDPWAAYRFAKGETIGMAPFDAAGTPAFTVRLRRPLDFAAVTDHAEFFGEVRICFTPSHPGYDSEECAALRSGFAAVPVWFGPLVQPNPPGPERFEFCGPDESNCLEVATTVWQQTQAAAQQAYDPTPACEFTSFIGYEWTANTAGANLHRNVIFANSNVPDLPVSYLDAPLKEELWDALEEQCLEAGTGCDVLAIPHNSNFSLGRMFLPENSDGSPLDSAGAARRAAMEPLVEIAQHKGISECRPGLGTNDELCDFNLMRVAELLPPPPGQVRSEFSPLSFVRNALKQGLLEQERTGVNPFQFGLVGGTDTHNSTAGFTREDEYVGHLVLADGTLPGRLALIDTNPGGLTVIWAEENSREALFAAMKRREVYATSGTRPVVRFFGSFFFPRNMCEIPLFNRLGYSLGVPMGAELQTPGYIVRHRSPRFAVAALRDPGAPDRPGAQLQRIQIIKGWVEDGEAHERVYDVAGDPDNGATVNPVTGESLGPGYDSLCTVWEDPDFESDQAAFYYARVLENPTWRWSTYQCKALGVDCRAPETVPPEFAACCAEDVPETIQERAWTSPIWYTP